LAQEQLQVTKGAEAMEEARWAKEARVETEAKARVAKMANVKVEAEAAEMAGAVLSSAGIKATRTTQKEMSPSVQVVEVTERLKGAMAGSLSRVNDLFKALDVDGSGLVDREEFRQSVGSLHLDAHVEQSHGLLDEACDRLFDEFDIDGTGQIAYREYVQHTLRTALARSYSKVMDVFSKWDADRSGTIDRRELHRAIKACGFEAPHGAIDEIFREVDTNASGHIEFRELHKILRQGSHR